MTWLAVPWILLALVWLADGLRLRKRAQALRALAPSDEPVAPGHRFLCAPGVVVDEATRRAASAHARREGLQVVDLVPHDLDVGRVLLLLANVDTARFRHNRIAPARIAGHALLVDDELLSRIDPPADAALAPLAARLKQHAPTGFDLAVAPGLRMTPDSVAERRTLLRQLFGDLFPLFATLQAMFLLLALGGLALFPIAAGLALLALHLQPVLLAAGTPLAPRDLVMTALFRAPLELWSLLRLAVAPRGATTDPVAPLRPVYRDLLGTGTEPFFEPRREDCPVCRAKELAPRLRTDDLLQNKPGRFQVDRCAGCGHLFQNPRLSLAGLDFYYRDFYDGLNEARAEALFSFAADPYLARARSVAGITSPRRWLDVGTGHGHFCLVAKDVWPEAKFDGLDLSSSLEEAKRRGWIDRAYRGLFPELAAEISGQYDVVSMSHYLEHTREPREEIAAAREALEPGGLLLIEVPDPASRIQHLLGRFWISWFQPQHQHYLSVENLGRILADEGFEPVRWLRGEAHLAVDFRFAVYLLLGRLSPAADLPWREPPSGFDRLAGAAVRAVGLPLLATAYLLDFALAPLFRRPGWSNTYRVVARRC